MDVRVKILIIYFLHLVCQLVVACTPPLADVTPRAVQAKVLVNTHDDHHLYKLAICGVVLCKYVCMYECIYYVQLRWKWQISLLTK